MEQTKIIEHSGEVVFNLENNDNRMTEKQKDELFQKLLIEGAQENILYWKQKWSKIKSLFTSKKEA